jgi:hypothetical protein
VTRAREQLIDGMWRRSEPTCIWCVATATGIDLEATVQASTDRVFRMVFDQSVGTCAECGSKSVLLHPPVIKEP